ncbi:MAG: hypothetical protein DLM59_15945 [Pseudonocardiales bacterium]|nr:MAG: hypothetical protein DLM59_15945 [Pseudonocardiales bacterium]
MTRLAQQRAARGWKKSQLVQRLMSEASRRGVAVASRESLMRMVAQWENGHRNPDELYGSLLCSIYDCDPVDLGLAASASVVGPAVGLSYEPQLGAALTALDGLTRLDLTGHSSVVRGGFAAEALNAVSLDWLFAAHSDDRRPLDAQVRAEDVAEIEATTATFDALDRRFGGEHSRTIAVNYLRGRVAPRLNGQYSDEVGRGLYAATASLCELIGWMGYDSAKHSLAQRYFVQALRFAREAGDLGYGTYVLTSMSDQALFLGRPDQALRLAQVAGSRESGPPPTVLAEAAVLEARACAELGNRAGASSALLKAEKRLERATVNELPAWASRFDATVLASHVGTCWISLERPEEARRALSVVWEHASGQPRRRAYAAVQLANTAALEGDVDEACALGVVAVEATYGMTSSRAHHHINGLVRRLKPHRDIPAVRELSDRVRTLTTSGAA